jgi:hypothetical protein
MASRLSAGDIRQLVARVPRSSPGPETRLRGYLRPYVNRLPMGQHDVSSAGQPRNGPYMTYEENHIQELYFGCIGLQSVVGCIAGTYLKHLVDQSERRTAHSDLLGILPSTLLISLYFRTGRLLHVACGMYRRYVPLNAHHLSSFVVATSLAHNVFTPFGRSCIHSTPANWCIPGWR